MKKGKEKISKVTFYKTNPRGESGISLIVLVITIIVIIILATAIIISLVKSNPISEANKARYESDRDNMQSIFTNTIGKIMAEKQGTIEIEAGRLNEPVSNKKSTVGEAVYRVSDNIGGKIIFDNNENTETEYYTGRQLPVYSKETIWHVDSEGILKLQVGDKEIIDDTENSDNEVINNDEINKKLELLSSKITDLEQKNKLLETSIMQLQDNRETKLIKRNFGISEVTTNKSEWTQLEQISLSGNGSGKAIISYTASTNDNESSLLQIELVRSDVYELLGTDSDTSNTSKNYLRASTTSVIPYDENTIIKFRLYTNQSFVPSYGYSILLIKDVT